MANEMCNTLIVSLITLASLHYYTSVKAAQVEVSDQAANYSQEKHPTINNNQSNTIFASPPIGYIAEGLGAAIAVAETEIVLANQFKPRINRAVFTHGIQRLEPIDTIVSISQSYGKMYFFTELSNYKGELIKHRWEHKGKIMAEIEFEIGAPHWRAYSSKNISIDGLGSWKVVVTNATGVELFSNSIMVVN